MYYQIDVINVSDVCLGCGGLMWAEWFANRGAAPVDPATAVTASAYNEH